MFERVQTDDKIEALVGERQMLDIRNDGWGPLVQQLGGEPDCRRGEIGRRQVGPQVGEVLREGTEAASDFEHLEPTYRTQVLLRKLVPRRRRRRLTLLAQIEVPGVVRGARVDGQGLPSSPGSHYCTGLRSRVPTSSACPAFVGHLTDRAGGGTPPSTS